MSVLLQHDECAKTNYSKVNRRETVDRRSFEPAPPFPIVDSFGTIVKKDRRSMPDRRIANIQVTEYG